MKKERVIKKEKIKQEPNVKAEPSTPAKRSRAVSAPTTRATRRQTRTQLQDTDDDLPLDAMALLGRRVMGLDKVTGTEGSEAEGSDNEVPAPLA